MHKGQLYTNMQLQEFFQQIKKYQNSATLHTHCITPAMQVMAEWRILF